MSLESEDAAGLESCASSHCHQTPKLPVFLLPLAVLSAKTASILATASCTPVSAPIEAAISRARFRIFSSVAAFFITFTQR
eukprot:CAMPEP_0195021502 /NCGR_PEP_ID=MMETSP0326_2-20130528/38053_1 /TAXON_ID=2866 ORGANISM="Crypthecodinium cohnii, Strain Seligo" /NCGR_SAMPLE_ID=MMETSP0326_2 /ASSEMBLY_ACC=CAM_ASM_000348 /LENGTH=80 /DNA_ID=CAMNT_0040040731 /DNA_START=439 /DNA_END=677 /DNA_ORIENTATION=+